MHTVVAILTHPHFQRLPSSTSIPRPIELRVFSMSERLSVTVISTPGLLEAPILLIYPKALNCLPMERPIFSEKSSVILSIDAS